MSTDEKKKVQPITRAAFAIAESKRTAFVAIIPHGTTLKDMESPDYFANVARDISIFDRIEVRAIDDTWWAELLVTYASSGGVKFEVLKEVVVEKPQLEDVNVEGFTVRWSGSVKKHVVIRDADKEIIKDGISRKADAIKWAEQHARNLAA